MQRPTLPVSKRRRARKLARLTALAGASATLAAVALTAPADASGPPRPDLSIFMEGPNISRQGDHMMYTAWIGNDGDTISTSTKVLFQGPAGWTKFAWAYEPGDCVTVQAGALCTIPPVPIDEEKSVQVVYNDPKGIVGNYRVFAGVIPVATETVVSNNIDWVDTTVK